MDNNVGLVLTKRAHLTPDREAYVDADSLSRVTFAELNDESNRTANLLKSVGVGKGDRVALLMMNSQEFCQSFFAVAKIGAVNVPLNWRLVADELEFILKNAGATVLIFGEEFLSVVSELHSRGDRTDIGHWIQVGANEPVADFASSFAEGVAAAPADEPPIGASDDDLCYIMYTSGTTGLPKGAVHTHNTCMWADFTLMATADYVEGDRYLLLLPMFHVGALTPLTLNVHLGVTSIVARAFDPGATWRLIQDEKVSTMLAVPAMLNFMMQVADLDSYDISTLRWVMSGAAPVPVTLIEQYAERNIEIQQIYGLTETCGPTAMIDSANALRKAGSTGKAFFHTDVRVVDAEGNDAAPGEPGEVLVRGRHVMKEYWQRPDATAETIRDGWLYTGDVAHLDEDGFLFIQDRIKDMIISGGENIYPAELEDIILGHPAVGEVAVIGQPSERWGESPFIVAVRTDDSLTEQALVDYCVGKMARYKLPVGAAFIDEIPRNPSGKILKRLLREQFPGPAD